MTLSEKQQIQLAISIQQLNTMGFTDDALIVLLSSRVGVSVDALAQALIEHQTAATTASSLASNVSSKSVSDDKAAKRAAKATKLAEKAAKAAAKLAKATKSEKKIDVAVTPIGAAIATTTTGTGTSMVPSVASLALPNASAEVIPTPTQHGAADENKKDDTKERARLAAKLAKLVAADQTNKATTKLIDTIYATQIAKKPTKESSTDSKASDATISVGVATPVTPSTPSTAAPNVGANDTKVNEKKSSMKSALKKESSNKSSNKHIKKISIKDNNKAATATSATTATTATISGVDIADAAVVSPKKEKVVAAAAKRAAKEQAKQEKEAAKAVRLTLRAQKAADRAVKEKEKADRIAQRHAATAAAEAAWEAAGQERVEWAQQAAVIMRGAAITTRMNANAAEARAHELAAQAKAASQAARAALKHAHETEKQAASAEKRAEATGEAWIAKKAQHAAKIAAKKLEKEQNEAKKKADKISTNNNNNHDSVVATPLTAATDATDVACAMVSSNASMPVATTLEMKESKEVIVDTASLSGIPSVSSSLRMSSFTDVDHVYLDAARLLYWSSSSRALAMRGQIAEAQTQFIREVEGYLESFNNKLKQLTIVFNEPIMAAEYAADVLRVDRRVATSSHGNLCHISVVGASPAAGGVDGYFIRSAMLPSSSSSSMPSKVFVTSDPFITTMLTSSGVSVLSPEMWQNLVISSPTPAASAASAATAAAAAAASAPKTPAAVITCDAAAAVAGDIALQRLIADEAAAESRARKAKIVPSSPSPSTSTSVPVLISSVAVAPASSSSSSYVLPSVAVAASTVPFA